MTKVDEFASLELAASARVRRTPLYFESCGAWLFGWVHQSDSSRGQCGVIISAPLGHEQIHAHRSLRHLADALAEAGFSVMRFDYHGTGDSTGVDEDADRLTTWLANLRSAIDWMRGEFGCAEISVIGIRLGATLAMQVAVEEPLVDLVLWAPVVKGQSYVREMKFLMKTSGVHVDGNKDIEAAGFVLTKETAHDLASFDLMQLQPRCRRALLVDRDDMPANAQLLDHLRGLGVEARQTPQPGYVKMMAEPHNTKVPHQAISEIVSWLCSGKAGSQAESLSMRDWPSQALMAGVCNGLLRESAIYLCQLPNLFGILSEPVAPPTAASELPTVIILNAGSAYHAGPNRLHVLLARRLAAAGFRCLRMDLHGLGDSVTPNHERENETHPATAFRDIHLVMEFLEREMDVSQMVLMGLCSGATAAFQSAVHFADPALLECVMINPLTFYWQEDMTVESAQRVEFKAYQHSKSTAIDGNSIQVNLDRKRHWHLANQLPQRGSDNSNPIVFPSPPLTSDLPADLKQIISNERILTFLFARSDPGFEIMTATAKSLIEEMCRTGQMSIRFIEGADHSFTRKAGRESLLETIVADLTERYCTASSF